MSINPWVFHREKDVWGQDADKFKPERWLVEDAARLDKYFIPVRTTSPPAEVPLYRPLTDMISQFGVGYMSCPGQHIARMELSKICSTVSVQFSDPWLLHHLSFGM